jgi:hypothetical protein
MNKPAVTGRTLTQSNPQPPPPAGAVVFAITATHLAAQRSTGEGTPLVLQQIQLSCTCSGTIGPDTYAGIGQAVIAAGTARVTCEGHELVLEGANMVVPCSGTTTAPDGTTKPNVPASVTVTVTKAGQESVLANAA